MLHVIWFWPRFAPLLKIILGRSLVLTLNLWPEVCACDCLSLPAKSTRLILLVMECSCSWPSISSVCWRKFNIYVIIWIFYLWLKWSPFKQWRIPSYSISLSDEIKQLWSFLFDDLNYFPLNSGAYIYLLISLIACEKFHTCDRF